MIESALHNLIIKDTDVQKSIVSLVNPRISTPVFVHEDQYPNGLYADFTLKDSGRVEAIIECKGSNIGVNDFVRGIGQVMQYQHFIDSKMSLRGYEYSENACAIYCFPSEIIRNKNFNIGLFKYPEKCKIIEVNNYNRNARLVSEKELQTLAQTEKNDLIAISQYYIRDNRLYELYICLKYCQYQKILGYDIIDRKFAELNFLRKLGTPNNRNWRNAFISLSSLGLIDDKNLPTIVGAKYASLSYPEFCYEIYESYIKEYINILMMTLITIKSSQNKSNYNTVFSADYTKISSTIDNLFSGKKVLFMTDSNNRYLSSWLNIMRDDYMCINYRSRHNDREIKYNITEINKSSMIQKISLNEQANSYIKKFESLLRGK